MKMKTSVQLSSTFLVCFIICFLVNIFVVEGLVPLSKTFKFVNHGKLPSNGISTENNAQFLTIPQITNYPFQLCFYTTLKAKNLFTLGLSMGGVGSSRTSRGDLRRWVWAANPNRSVGKNATLTFSRNGNLVLADSNGRVVWQTQTPNKGVTDIKLLSNGNLVLLEKTGRFVWQSFDYPTDTLLNGQGLTVSGSSKLVSGSYSMDVDRYPVLLFKSKKNPAMIYHTLTDFVDSYDKVNFFADGKRFGLFYEGPGDSIVDREVIMAQRKYNTTLSMLRLEKEGNLHVYTYNGRMKTWEISKYSYFIPSIYECSMPEKCGFFGLCKNRKCVSCPSSKGLMAWSKECKREKIPPCNSTKSKVDYYKMESVSSSIRTANNKDYKKMTVDECKKKCSKDCKCTGVFYRSEEGTCMVATMEIYTLTSDTIRFELGYIEPEVDTYIKYAK